MFFFVRWTNYHATTGPSERRFDFACASCHARIACLVRTVGFGSATSLGGGVNIARQRATKAAASQAVNAFHAAPCPVCGAHQPTILAEVEQSHRRQVVRRRLRLPLAVVAAAATLALLATPALHDLAYSHALPVATLFTTVFAGALVFWLFSKTAPVSSDRRADVFFWRNGSGAGTWVPAAPVPGPTLDGDSSIALQVSLATWLVSGGAALVAIGVWTKTFVPAYVVTPETPDGPFSVRVDGGELRQVGLSPADEDVTSTRVTVRRGQGHRLEVVDARGRQSVFTLDDASDGKNGWVVAPNAAARDMCIVDTEAVYTTARNPAPPKTKVLNRRGEEIVTLDHSFDSYFYAPASVEARGEVRKSTLRAFVCSDLARDVRTPIRRRAR